MPVLFKGRSEYNRHYRWNPSYRSASFAPKQDQLASDAGLRSDEVISSLEPRIATKKKVWHRESQVQNCLFWWPESGTEDGSSHDGDASVPVKNGNASPIMKAYGRKEKENKLPGKRKNINVQGSRSLDGSFTFDAPRKDVEGSNFSKNRRQTLKQQTQSKVIEENYENKRAPRESAGRRASSPRKRTESRSHQGTKSSPESTIAKRSSLKVTDDSNKSTQHSSVEIPKKSPKKTRQSSATVPLQHEPGSHAGKPQRLSKTRQTEYQRNFASPRIVARSSPLLSATDVVHLSSPAIPPHSGVKFQSTSEYLSKFKGNGSPDRSGELTRRPQTAPSSPSMKLKVKDIQKPYFAATKKKSFKSEYSSQFEASTENQIGKLREMAEKNKQRHQGTHIDPEHATQIVSPYNKCWEASSNGSIVKGEVNGNITVSDIEEQWSKASQKGSDPVPTDEDEETEFEVDSLERESISRESVRKQRETEHEIESDSESTSKSSVGGRLPTPRLQKMGGALRTHLDLTTPSQGGALLISSPSRARSESSGSYVSLSTFAHTHPIAGSPTQDEQNLLKGREYKLVRSSPCIQTQSIKKRDQPKKTPEKNASVPAKALLVEKESSPERRWSSSQPIRKPAPYRAPIRGSLKNEEFQHCGPTGMIQMTPTFARVDDGDALSIASSRTSARASELLQKAKQRKSFWRTT